MRHTSTPPRQRMKRGIWQDDQHLGTGCGMDSADHCPDCGECPGEHECIEEGR